MADYAADYTARLRVRYQSGGYEHSFLMRARHSLIVTPETELVTKANAFLAASAGFLFADWSVIGADFAPRNSSIFLPVAGVNTPTGKNALAPLKGRAPAFFSFQGRSEGGSKCRLSLFGTMIQGDSDAAGDYRFTGGESGDFQTVVGVLNAGFVLGGVDGGRAVWYPYTNIGYNAHWQRTLRG